MARRPQPLSRTHVRLRTDKPTNSVLLEYVGSRLKFHTYVYGFLDGTFFVANLDEVPYPPSLQEAADQACVDLDRLPGARVVREAAAAALAAGAMADAPELLSDLASPRVMWQPWDLRDLQRKHMIAVAKLGELTRMMESEVRARSGQRCPDLPEVPSMSPISPMAGSEYLPARTVYLPRGSTGMTGLDVGPVPPCPSCEEPAGEDEGATLSSAVVERAKAAVKAAREAELPQRLPQGVRRRLRKMPAGVYLSYGEALDIRGDFCAALTDGRVLGRKDRDVTVVDWDGEWPVAVRRYGQGGRTIYKVEDALRRAGVAAAA